MKLNSDKIIQRAGEIYEEFNHAHNTKDKLKSNQVRAAIMAICEEINKQSKFNNINYEETPIK